MMMDSIILSSAYLPPVSYFALMCSQNKVFVDKHEGFVKQTYRNRCYIYGANGKQPLVIPVIKRNNTLITEVRIDYSSNWNVNHWRSIESAYNKSPFFLYYYDYFNSFFTKKYNFLFDLNTELTILIRNLLKLDKDILFTEDYKKIYFKEIDYRNIISPKNKNSSSFIVNGFYNQVFSDKYGFINDLSIIDLLFNRGNLSVEYLSNLKLNII